MGVIGARKESLAMERHAACESEKIARCCPDGAVEWPKPVHLRNQ